MVGEKRSLTTTPLWLIALLGTCVTAFGVYIQVTGRSAFAQMAAGTLAALGGGIIGAAISIYFSAGDGRDTLLSMRELLGSTLRARIRSEESDLRPVRRHWHYYHLTQRDGEMIWRHTDYHFEQSMSVGSITHVIKDYSYDREHFYRAEVAVRGDRLILVEAPEDGSEPPIVSITPFFTDGFRRVRAGVTLLRSWDGNDLLTKCLWSRTSLISANGPDVSSQDGLILDDL